ncbi:Cut9-interacting protein scn1 [Vanrija pseudolonga]|uniref:Cut9-interacting protein scn1 n=1 Tax=Vanrija pseudolonga TaxID=143232 RepID=A0AAF0Y494_9TREE|nr:Cut9-interacting protein scn1 [Vanrija pseudolonga]
MCNPPQPGTPGPSTPPSDTPPDWESITLPAAHILAHLTDAHCHPTDLSPSTETYDAVQLGGLAAMAVCDDQSAVAALGAARGWAEGEVGPGKGRVVAAFGYHPWFSHRFSLHDPAPPKEEHYLEVFAPKPALAAQLGDFLPLLPEPESFSARLERIRSDVVAARAAGRLAMVGEIGLDSAARVRIWPRTRDESSVLTPFRTTLAHQTALARAQLALAVELGVPASVHCVAASGPTLRLLESVRAADARFSRINIDMHSCGGWKPEFLAQAARTMPNLYFSPSVLLTARSPAGAAAVRAIPRDRVLVESDLHDVAQSTRLVWASVLWVAACRGWRVESAEQWEGVEEEDDEFDEKGRLVERAEGEVWAVRTIERNWARFMGLI